MKSLTSILVFAALSLSQFVYAAQEQTISVTPERLTVENIDRPSVVERTSPRLSWNIRSGLRSVQQQAYRIIVSSSEEKALACNGDLWDSGKVNSDECLYIPYKGVSLPQNTEAFWRVKVFTNVGESEWSETSSWSTGLYSFKAWNAQWIGKESFSEGDKALDGRLAARYLRKEFNLDNRQIVRATAFISGLGWYELFINGERIGDQELAPSPTDFRKVQHYNAFDVTDKLLSGSGNAVGVALGNSCYFAMRQNKPYKNNNFGFPKMLFTLIVEYSDGSKTQVSSDSSWRITDKGPIVANNEYDGEEYDARLEMDGWNKIGFNDKGWRGADRTQIPIGELRGMMHPFIKVNQTLQPVSINRLEDGRYIVDMGQNMTGWLRIKVKGNRGDTVKLRFAETLLENGELSTANLRGAKVTDTYILAGKSEGEEWHPSFTYHGFRFVEVSGWPGKLEAGQLIGEVLYDDMESVGTFESDNDILNKIVQNAWWGISGNYKGMPVDCPQRNERQPWLGDRIQGSLSESYLFNNEALYDKWVNDILEAQRYDGSIPDVAPAFWNYYSDNMTWPSSLPFACEMLYDQWGNIEPIQRSYPAIKKWLSYMKNEYMGDDYIITKDSYGDWCMPPEGPEIIHSKDPLRITDSGIIATSFYCKMLSVMIRFAELTGNQQDIAGFEDLHAKVKNALNSHYFNTEGYYGNNTVTANILPLTFGLIPEGRVDDVCDHILKKIASDGFKTSSGVLGTQWQLRELTKMGRGDIAYAIATTTGYPSWGYMVKKGATTIWELFNGDTANPSMNSGNHVMLVGDMLSWCFGDLAGIKSAEPGYRSIWMQPAFEIDDSRSLKASYRSARGLIRSEWSKTAGKIDWSVSIPAGTTAKLVFPAASANSIMESGKALANCNDAQIIESTEGRIVVKIGSGDYNFSFSYHNTAHAGVIDEGFIYNSAEFPQCHAATAVQLNDGRIAAAWFGGAREGADDVCIWYSVKDSKTGLWSTPILAADGVYNKDLRKACYNPVLWQVPGGPLYLYFKIGRNVADWKFYFVSSRNGGKTWSKRQELPEGINGPVKNKPIMHGKRLVSGSSLESGGWRIHFEVSDDNGKTWRNTGDVPGSMAVQTQDGTVSPIQAIQPAIIELKDGTLKAFCRSRSGLVAISESRDGGETWTEVSLSDVPNNNSGLDVAKLNDGRYLMVYNKVRTAPGTPKGARTPLNIAISEDGETWYDSIVLEDCPLNQYSYPSVICDKDGMVHIVYTWRRTRIKYMMIDPSKLPVGQKIHYE